MTAFDRFDDRFGARLHDAIEDLASPQYPDYIDDVLAKAVAQRQRPAWTFPERWIPMSTLARRPSLAPALPWRTIGIALLLMALLVAGAIISFGLRQDPLPAPFGPAANGLISYQAEGDIYTLDLVTGEERLIVGGPAVDVGPGFSRDGQSVAWLRLEENEALGGTLMVANADGSDARALLGPLELISASWSPTSDSMAVITAPIGGEATLSIVSTRSGEIAEIAVPVQPEVGVEWRPPDGDELIFGAADHGVHSIYGVRPDGTELRQIAPDGNHDSYWAPYDITPDGGLMLYSTGGDLVDIHVLDLRTGEERPFGASLPEPEDFDGNLQHHGSPSILPDGKTIVFGRYWNEHDDTINHQMWAASIAGDGADAVAIGPVHRSQSGHNPFWQAVAPDGTKVLVFENDTNEAWLADPTGGPLESVDLPQLGDPPSWQRVAVEP